MIGFYVGSFDPFTFGHLEILKKSASIFERVYLGIVNNPQKNRSFDKYQMKNAIEDVIKHEKLVNVKCIVYEGLAVDLVEELKIDYFIRGIRNIYDFINEENLTLINKEITGIDTVYFRADKYNYLSSSMVNELIRHKKDISKYVPAEVLELISKN